MSGERSGGVFRWMLGLGVEGSVLLALAAVGIHLAFNTDRIAAGTLQKHVTSRDGTTIAYEQTGSGQPVILVAAALADRGGTRRLASHLAEHFRVINYDRRGRGRSSDKQPYAVQREIEDIEALIDESGGSALLFGSSSGSALALDAASKLGSKVKRLFVYEPPFIVDDSHPAVPDDLGTKIAQLTSARRQDDAVRLFFTKAMGIPDPAVTIMQYVMPGWSRMAKMAHTASYDLTVLSGTQSGKPLSATRWATDLVPTLVAVGSRSEPFFHHGAQALVAILPQAQYMSLQGRDHSAVLFASGALATAAERFFLSGDDRTPFVRASFPD